MSAGPSHADLYEKIGALDARMDNVEGTVKKIDDNVEKLTEAANMGRGAYWAAVKMGGLTIACAGAVAWAWDRIRGMTP